MQSAFSLAYFYMIMLTELLAANLLLFMEHNCPVIHDFIIGSPYVVLIHICPEGQKKGITIVYTIEFPFSFPVECSMMAV